MENGRIDEEKMMQGTASEQCVQGSERELADGPVRDLTSELEYARKKMLANLREAEAIEEKMRMLEARHFVIERRYMLRRQLLDVELTAKKKALDRWTRIAMELEAESGNTEEAGGCPKAGKEGGV